mmetsp:Transcript_97717/g.276423  ORF Transcript_97717/g.276423 Transcript_97717/m.276423 type:complete len:246 (+) Transcript_97717:207-944(+)
MGARCCNIERSAERCPPKLEIAPPLRKEPQHRKRRATREPGATAAKAGGRARADHDAEYDLITAEDLLDEALEASHERPERMKRSNSVDSARSGYSEGASSIATQSSSAFGDMTKEERKEAKQLVKNFTREMVKGKKTSVMLPRGQLKTCFFNLNRKLDTLRIKNSKESKGSKDILLANIDEILAGEDVTLSAVAQGIETPIDDLCVTLVISGVDCLTFRMPDFEARDTFVMCLTIFTNEAKSRK